MCVKVSDTVLPLITGLCITFVWDIYIWRLWEQWEDNSTHPSIPYSAIMLQLWLPGPLFETWPTLEEKHLCESLRHSVITHNWFVHYLWDIYGGFGRTVTKMANTFNSFPHETQIYFGTLHVTFDTQRGQSETKKSANLDLWRGNKDSLVYDKRLHMELKYIVPTSHGQMSGI